MAITRTPMVDDDGTGTTGTVINNAWKQQLYDQIDAADADAALTAVWVAVPYSAANFTASAGTWTVPSGNVLYRYCKIGKLAVINLNCSSTTTSAATNQVRVQLPAALATSGIGAWNLFRGTDSATGTQALVCELVGNLLRFERFSGTFAAQSNTLHVIGQIMIEVA